MLNGELDLLKQWAASGADAAAEAAGGGIAVITKDGERIRKAWQEALFSDVTNDCLARYFNHHLRELSAMGRQLDPVDCLTLELLSLTDHLWAYYAAFLDPETIVPPAYQERFIADMAPVATGMARHLAAAAIPANLKSLLAYLEEIACIPPDGGHSFQALFYFKIWLLRLSELNLDQAGAEADLHAALELLNFNDLAYLNLRQKAYSACAMRAIEKLRHLGSEKGRLMALPLNKGLFCRSGWPPINVLLCGWLAEEVIIVEQEIKSGETAAARYRPEKFPLNLSVAHLACLLNLFCGENVPGEVNLTGLFKFVTDHFSTKRQKDISARSLSKEYYSTTQVTAANVQGLLQHMITRINRKYFPLLAWLAAGAALYFLPGS